MVNNHSDHLHTISRCFLLLCVKQKMIRLLYSLSILFVAFGCKAQDGSSVPPECIRQKIEAIKSAEVWNPPAKIFSYTYDDQKVYFVPSRCCDIPSVVYDEECNPICSPDGGITGKGDGKCSDFYDSRTDEELIWEDTREN